MTSKTLLDITVPMAIKGQNEFQWAGWWAYHRYKTKWDKVLGYLAKRRAKKPEQKRYVLIVSYRVRLLDEGNLIGGAKPILDYLSVSNYLKDDAPEWVSVAYKQEKDKARAGSTRIVVIEEIQDAAERPVQSKSNAGVDTGTVGREVAEAGTKATGRGKGGRKAKAKTAVGRGKVQRKGLGLD